MKKKRQKANGGMRISSGIARVGAQNSKINNRNLCLAPLAHMRRAF